MDVVQAKARAFEGDLTAEAVWSPDASDNLEAKPSQPLVLIMRCEIWSFAAGFPRSR